MYRAFGSGGRRTSPLRLRDGKKGCAQGDAHQQRRDIAPQAGVEGNPDRHGRVVARGRCAGMSAPVRTAKKLKHAWYAPLAIGHDERHDT